MLVFAEDSLQAFRLTRRTRSFGNSSTADIARQLASDHGLTPSIDLAGPTRPVVAQVNQSDLAFLRSLARADDGEVWLDGTNLYLSRRPDRDGGSFNLFYGGGLVSMSVRADLADQCTEIRRGRLGCRGQGPHLRDRRLRGARQRARQRHLRFVHPEHGAGRPEGDDRPRGAAGHRRRHRARQGRLPRTGPPLRLRHRADRRYRAHDGGQPGQSVRPRGHLRRHLLRQPGPPRLRRGRGLPDGVRCGAPGIGAAQ